MNRQSGFSITVVVLILVLVGDIGFTGWYVWHSQQVAMATYSQAAAAETTNSSSSATKYLVIQNWAVRLAYTGPYQLTYTTNLNNPSVVGISSASLTALDHGCADNGAGVVERFIPGEVPTPGPETIEQLATAHPDVYSHVGVYYYMVQHSQAACSTNSSAQALQAKLLKVMDTARVVYIP